MIYTQQHQVTYIYPFNSPGVEPVLAAPCIVVRRDGIYLDLDRMALNPEMARKLARALLHAVGLVEAGQTG